MKAEDVSSNSLNHSGEILVNSFVGNFFDALKMYGTALVEILGKVELKQEGK